jgi:hypothetical protein
VSDKLEPLMDTVFPINNDTSSMDPVVFTLASGGQLAGWISPRLMSKPPILNCDGCNVSVGKPAIATKDDPKWGYEVIYDTHQDEKY